MIDEAKEVKWALFSWFEESGAHLIHPDDLDRIRKFNPYGVVFSVLSEDGEYTEIGTGGNSFRVRTEALKLFKPEKQWIFKIGESVSVIGRDYVGLIENINWHHNAQKPMYRLKVAGKLKSRRYWPDELKKLQKAWKF